MERKHKELAMPRLKTISTSEATGATKELYDAINKKMGKVPNIFLGMGNSPAALQAYLGIGGALAKGALESAEKEVVALAVSQHNNCQYCLSAHTAIGKMAGLKEDEIIKIRQGSGEGKKSQLAAFVQAVLRTKGFVSDADLAAVRAAGYSDAQIVEVLMVVAETVFTNFFNHVNDTVNDFPQVQPV
jgi:uncharacterized peroxidase-related enzyme